MRTYTFTSAEAIDYGFDYPIVGTLGAWLARTGFSLLLRSSGTRSVLDDNGRIVGIVSIDRTEG